MTLNLSFLSITAHPKNAILLPKSTLSLSPSHFYPPIPPPPLFTARPKKAILLPRSALSLSPSRFYSSISPLAAHPKNAVLPLKYIPFSISHLAPLFFTLVTSPRQLSYSPKFALSPYNSLNSSLSQKRHITVWSLHLKSMEQEDYKGDWGDERCKGLKREERTGKETGRTLIERCWCEKVWLCLCIINILL